MTLPERLDAYNTPEGAQRYLDEYDKVHRKVSDRRERRILSRWARQIGAPGTVLDVPCGWGRYLPFFNELGASVADPRDRERRLRVLLGVVGRRDLLDGVDEDARR